MTIFKVFNISICLMLLGCSGDHVQQQANDNSKVAHQMMLARRNVSIVTASRRVKSSIVPALRSSVDAWKAIPIEKMDYRMKCQKDLAYKQFMHKKNKVLKKHGKIRGKVTVIYKVTESKPRKMYEVYHVLNQKVRKGVLTEKEYVLDTLVGCNPFDESKMYEFYGRISFYRNRFIPSYGKSYKIKKKKRSVYNMEVLGWREVDTKP